MPTPARPPARRFLVLSTLAVLTLAAADRAQSPGDPQPPERGESGESAGGGGREGGETGGGDPRLPAPLGPFFEAANPGRLQRALDEWFGFDSGTASPKPRAPEIPLAVFRTVIRPLGSLKYETQPSYFVGSFTARAPTLQFFSYDYVFADWNAARFEVSWANADPETIILGYQRTLRVGPRNNWVDGVTLVPEFNVPNRFVGGSAVYTFAWKPEEKSPWTVAPSVGANRVARETEATGSDLDPAAVPRRERVSGVWRPLLTLNAWYTFSPAWTVGVENDALPSDRLAEYLVLPHFMWRPTEHFFVQAGAGYYQLGSEGQATFMCRVNLLFPSPRRPRGGGESGGP